MVIGIDNEQRMSNPEASVQIDLDTHLERKMLRLVFSNGTLSLIDGKDVIDAVKIENVESAEVERGLGIDRLSPHLTDGRKVDFAFFTKERSDEVRRFAAWLMSIRQGEMKNSLVKRS